MNSSNPEITFEFPVNLNPSSLCSFSKEVAEAPVVDWCRFDAGPNRFFSPTAMIFLVKICRARARCSTEQKQTYRGLQNHGYANNLGFSNALNLKENPYSQNAFGGVNYIPISIMTREELDEARIDQGVELGDVITQKCAEIAKVVSQGVSSELTGTLTHCFTEIFRNTFEHAEHESVVYCAQYWPATKKVEICISDAGVGIYSSLKNNPYVHLSDDREAIYHALMPGISATAWRNKKKRRSQRSEWDNSGYGLFITHQIFGKLGHFLVATGDSALLIRKGEKSTDLDCSLKGTLVSMSLDLSCEKEIASCVLETQKLAFSLKEKIGTRSVDIASVENFLKEFPVS